MEEKKRSSGGRRVQQQPAHTSSRTSSGRASRAKKSRTFNTFVYVLFVIGISTVLATLIWITANDALALNKEPHTAVITVTDDESFGNVVRDLKENGIISYKSAFRFYSMFSKADQKIVAGTYELNTDMDYRAIVTNMSARSATRVEVSVTIPEGYTVAQIFQKLQDEGVSTVDKLNDMAANHDYAFSFLQDIPLGNSTRLEGYLFPDTYDFYMGEDPKTIINKMLVNFDAKVTDEMRQDIADSGRAVSEIVNVASIIEKETDGTDRDKIASVIYNRLNHPKAATAGYLNIDATIYYVTGRLVTQDDYKNVDSPYNTYLYKGLPAGPISDPGMASIKAAMNPANTSYYYYALGDDEKHHFFKTYSAFQSFLSSQKSSGSAGNG